MEVDVADSGVQWGKYLRVRVKIDCSKKLVRGKKITIEGGRAGGYSSNMNGYPTFVIDVASTTRYGTARSR